MNLWVKRTGQFFIAALFLMSCEDDSFLLGFKNQNKKFNVRYQEFTLPSSVILIDSLTTDNYLFGDTYRLLVGQYMDPAFGTVRSEAYTQLQPLVFNALEAGSIYDSITLQLRLDFYSYGREGVAQERITVHEILEDSLSAYKRYYYNSTLGYDAFSLGEASLDVNYDSLKKNLSAGTSADTLLFKLKLDDSFGTKLFNLALNNPDSAFTKNKKFKYEIKGLVFVPSSNSMILGINPNTGLSKLTLHYHTPTDTLTRVFQINPGSALSFNNISTARSGDLGGMSEKYVGYAPPSGYRYLQNGSPVITKLDISEFNDFVSGAEDGVNDSITNMVINSAEISMEVETPPIGMPPVNALVFRIMKIMDSKDLFMNRTSDEDSTAMREFYVFGNGYYYYPTNDGLSSTPQTITLKYNSTKKKYTGHMALFMQSLFDKKEEDRKAGVPTTHQIQYLGLVPVDPAVGKTVERSVIKGNSIKLKVEYTRPIVPNQ
ncbi:MAG: DUF4270 family protein [Cyclobacteriaceae bacterium]